MRSRTIGMGAIAVLLILALVAAITVVLAIGATSDGIKTSFRHVFYNDTAPSNRKNHNSGDILDGDFNSSILEAAPEEVRSDPEDHVEYFVNDVKTRIYDESENKGDSALLAQHAVDASLRAPKTVEERLLPNAKHNPDLWSEITLDLVDNPLKHIETANKLFAVWDKAERVLVRKITGGYKSMGYMRRNGILLDATRAKKLGRDYIPMPILSESTGREGYELVFIYSNGEELAYRINCGYQPDITKWKRDPKPTPPPGKPTPTPNPTPKTTKNPANDPVNQGNADRGGGSNSDPGPGKYQPTKPPKQSPPPKVSADPTPKPSDSDSGVNRDNAEPPAKDPIPVTKPEADRGNGKTEISEPPV